MNMLMAAVTEVTAVARGPSQNRSFLESRVAIAKLANSRQSIVFETLSHLYCTATVLQTCDPSSRILGGSSEPKHVPGGINGQHDQATSLAAVIMDNCIHRHGQRREGNSSRGDLQRV
jgi:hypothetical protein